MYSIQQKKKCCLTERNENKIVKNVVPPVRLLGISSLLFSFLFFPVSQAPLRQQHVPQLAFRFFFLLSAYVDVRFGFFLVGLYLDSFWCRRDSTGLFPLPLVAK